MWWHILVGMIAGLVLLYLGMLLLLWWANRGSDDPSGLRETMRVLPDLLGLLRRLVSDPQVPRRVRLTLVVLIGYLASPIDLVPDFIPVLGYADDAIVVAIALRSVVRHAGPEAITRHWRGTPEGLRLINRLAGQPHRDAPP